MTSPRAITLLSLLIWILFATAVPSAAPSAARSAASSTSSSVEFSEKSVSDHEETNRTCKKEIDGDCISTACCRSLCGRLIRYGKIVDVGYRVKDGVHQCLCTVVYQVDGDPCAP